MKTKRLAAALLAATALTLPITSFSHEEGHWRHREHDHDGFGPLGWLFVGTVATAAALALIPARVIEPRPVYVQPPMPVAPPVATAPAPMWYYCSSAGQYYPYVQSCPTGWTAVPASPGM